MNLFVVFLFFTCLGTGYTEEESLSFLDQINSSPVLRKCCVFNFLIEFCSKSDLIGFNFRILDKGMMLQI